jgi:hypothetical protein
VNHTIIPCPKCRQPGILYSERSIQALIASKHIAHVLHGATKRPAHLHADPLGTGTDSEASPTH